MHFRRKNISYLIIVFVNFLSGVEYAVVLPTALQYLQKYGGNEFYLGLCLSAYSFSDLLSSPLLGRWSDKFDNTKLIILFANIWQILGSFIYFIGRDKWLIIAGRFIAGIGAGVGSCCFSEVVKTTEAGERSKILARIMIGRQIGLIIGPAANFLVLNLNVKIGPFELNSMTAPGFIMAILWIIFEIVVLFFYKNLTEIHREETSGNNSEERTRLLSGNTERQPRSSTYQSLRSINNEIDETDSTRVEANADNEAKIDIVDNSQTGPFVVRLYNDYIREEVVAVLSITFTSFFMQTALEAMITPITKQFFNWSDTENSILYAGAGLEILLVFLLLSFLTKKISDRALLVIGLAGNLITLVYLFFYLPHAVVGRTEIKDILAFILPLMGNVFSLPFIAIGSISALSKITRKETQGLTQGIRRSVVGIACIYGPIWAGVFYGEWYILFSSLIGIVSLSLLMLLLSYKWLERPAAT